MTGKEIVARAQSLSKCKYWFGGKRELASVSLAKRLQSESPSVWTNNYYNRALEDVDGVTHVCDCSGLVCFAYGIGDISSYGIRDKYTVYTGVPKAGMIGWKSGHVGIFSRDGWDAPIIEMRAQAYDYQASRTFKECGFTKVLYSKDVNYDESSTQNDTTKVGWHKDAMGWWYRHTEGTGEGTYYHECCAHINGHFYFFDRDGYICTFSTPVQEAPGATTYISKWERVKPESETGWLL